MAQVGSNRPALPLVPPPQGKKGRPKVYVTPEQQKERIKLAKKKYYDSHKDEIKQKACTQYRQRKELNDIALLPNPAEATISLLALYFPNMFHKNNREEMINTISQLIKDWQLTPDSSD